MKRAVFAVPGDLSTPTGGYVYDRRMVEGLRTLGWQIDIIDLGEGFPMIDEARKKLACELLASAPRDAAVIVDGLALGALPDAAAALAGNHRVVALVHHPLARETGLSDAQKASLHQSEKDALAQVRGVIVTSAATKNMLVSDYSIAPALIAVVRPGVDKVPPARGSKEPLSLLAVGSIVPRKGYDVLIAALAMLKDLPWTLTIVGDRMRDPATASRVDGDIVRHDLGDRIHVAGAVSNETLADFYASADVFVLASRFEGYGMALADAIAYGLPVVATDAGAIAEAAPAGASVLVPPDDAGTLAAALREVIADATRRNRLAAHARSAASRLPAWRDQVALFARAIESFA